MRTEFKAASPFKRAIQIRSCFTSPSNNLKHKVHKIASGEKKILSTKSGENPVERKKKSFSNSVVSLFNINVISLTAYIVSLV